MSFLTSETPLSDSTFPPALPYEGIFVDNPAVIVDILILVGMMLCGIMFLCVCFKSCKYLWCGCCCQVVEQFISCSWCSCSWKCRNDCCKNKCQKNCCGCIDNINDACVEWKHRKGLKRIDKHLELKFGMKVSSIIQSYLPWYYDSKRCPSNLLKVKENNFKYNMVPINDESNYTDIEIFIPEPSCDGLTYLY